MIAAATEARRRAVTPATSRRRAMTGGTTMRRAGTMMRLRRSGLAMRTICRLPAARKRMGAAWIRPPYFVLRSFCSAHASSHRPMGIE
eukprot:2336310-Prymnesium_polylepis.1